MLPTIRPPAAGDPPGLKKLGRYECTEQVGGGGGFETYRARVKGLTGLDRSFAVKVLRLKRSEIANAVSEPFLQAARRSATLADPHIARVVEADSGDGLVFAVTPFMEGADLGQFLNRAREAGVLATGKDEAAHHWHSLVAYIGAEIARGLQAAHAQEPPVIHGALCPGNVFITTRGAVRLLDFGLRASVRRPFEPRPRRLLPYIAPELAAPAADCTTPGDLYSLGVLLCELSSGDLPPQGRRASELQIALSLLPEDLGLLIGRLVSLSPPARPMAADAVSSLAAVYADTSEAALAAALSSLIQRSSIEGATPEEPSEAVVSLAGASEAADDAPPPPSEVKHDDAYGFEEPPHARANGPAKPAASGPGRSLPPSPPSGEYRPSGELTTVGEPGLIDDLVAKSRPSLPAFSSPFARPGPSPLPPPDPASFLPALAPPAPASSPASRERGSTMRGFGPTGTTALDAPPATVASLLEGSSGATEEWALGLPAWPLPPVTPSSPATASPLSAPAQAFSGGEEAASPMEDTDEVTLPSASVFEAPPATWGARALAALGGQAGIGPPVSSQSTGLGLLDEVEVEAPEYGSRPFPASPRPPSGLGGRLQSPRPFALDEPPLAQTAPAEVSPPEAAPEMVSQASGDEAMVAALTGRGEAEMSRGEALLEDELVDSPEGVRRTSPWPSEGASATPLGKPTGAARGAPLPEAFAYVDNHSPSAAQAAVFVDEEPPSAPQAEAYLDDGHQAAVSAAYFEETYPPPPSSEIAALPEAAGPAGPPPLPRGPDRPLSGERTGAVRRPARQQASVPAWARSPEEHTAKHGNRRLVWTIAASVLGASVVAGGLAGFFVGSRGKPWSAMLGGRRTPALSGPQAKEPADRDEVKPRASPPSNSEAAAKPPAAGTPRVLPTVDKTASAAKKGGAEQSLPPAPPSLAAQKTTTPPEQKVIAAGGVAPATWSKGIPDGASAGSLVALSVASQPAGASVWINGKERGRTPLQVRIQPGPARVVLVLAGHASATIDATAGEGVQVSKELLAVAPPLTGEARFRAECTTQGKLPIVVDGKETGVLCPFTKLRVDPGVHKIGLFVPALGQVHEKEVTLHPGVRSIVFAD